MDQLETLILSSLHGVAQTVKETENILRKIFLFLISVFIKWISLHIADAIVFKQYFFRNDCNMNVQTLPGKAMVVVHAADFFLACCQMDGYLLDLTGEATASEPFIRLIGGDLAMAARLVKNLAAE